MREDARLPFIRHTPQQKRSLHANPDGIMLSNGPGDPKECTAVIEEIQKLYESDIPIFAICLGHQLMALATGADTHKMKYGHRGGNHPVKDLETGRVYISSQNHGYVVDTDKLGSESCSAGICECQRRNQRRTDIYRKKYFYRTVPSGSMPGTTGFRISV